MRHKFNIKSLALGALLGAVVMFSIAATTGKSAWEYKIIEGKLERLAGTSAPLLGEQLDKAAADGWEVVTAAHAEFGPFVILRRAK